MRPASSSAALSLKPLGAGVVGAPPPPPLTGGVGGFVVKSHPAFTADIYAFL